MATRIRVTISPYLLTVEDRLLSYIYINSCLQHAFEPRYLIRIQVKVLNLLDKLAPAELLCDERYSQLLALSWEFVEWLRRSGTSHMGHIGAWQRMPKASAYRC